MDISIRDAVAGYVTTVLACALVARRRFEAREAHESVLDVTPLSGDWPTRYSAWMSGHLVYIEKTLCADVAQVTGVPVAIVSAILAQLSDLPAQEIRTLAIVERCHLAALHVLVGPLGGVRL